MQQLDKVWSPLDKYEASRFNRINSFVSKTTAAASKKKTLQTVQMHKQVRPSGESGVSTLTNVARQLSKVSPLHKKYTPAVRELQAVMQSNASSPHICVCVYRCLLWYGSTEIQTPSFATLSNQPREVNTFGTNTVRVQLSNRSGMGLGGTAEKKTRWRWRHWLYGVKGDCTAAEEEADGSFRKAQSFREGIHPNNARTHTHIYTYTQTQGRRTVDSEGKHWLNTTVCGKGGV